MQLFLACVVLEGKVPSKKGHEAAGAKEAETVTIPTDHG